LSALSKTLIVILGSTAVGKTTLSISIAQRLNTEIVSADARQFYKEMNIGTAKPSADELKKVKHHLINSLSVTDDYDVSRFEKDALTHIENIFAHHQHAVMAGGSGMYIDAVCNGMDALPPSDDDLRSELRKIYNEKGIEALQQQLKILDPIYHNSVDLANPHRLMRAIEVCLLTGKKYSSYRTEQKVVRPFNIIKVGLNTSRNELYERINARVDEMIEQGLVEEVRSLLPHRHLNALNTVGYKELFEYLDGNISLDDATNKIKQNTRNYAKRQLTWFKRDKEIRWFEPEESDGVAAFLATA
jgi:tRNA dimethylallyltransferase